MELHLCLLMALASSAVSAPNGVPVMQLSAQDSAYEDPYSEGITIFAEPNPYQVSPYSAPNTDAPNAPNFRFGLPQQAFTKNPNYWYQPTNAAGGGLLQDHFGNKIYFSNLNLPQLPLTVNVPHTVNSFSNYLSSSFNRFQQFLSQIQQSTAQLAASAQNIKGDGYYQYGPPSHQGLLSQILKPKNGVGYFKTAERPDADSYAPVAAYQVIAVMPMYDSPPIKVSDYLRKRSMDLDKPQSHNPATEEGEAQIPSFGSVLYSELEKEVAKEMKKEVTEVVQVDDKEMMDFAKDVAKEVASAVTVAAQKPGKVTEVMVRVDAKNVDDDDDDSSSSSSSSSSEEDGDDAKKGDVKKTDPEKKKDGTKGHSSKKNSSEEEDDSSDSSNSSESKEVPTTSTVPPKRATKVDQKKVPLRSGDVDEGHSSEESSEELDSVEKVAKAALGARPVRVDLNRTPTKGGNSPF